MDRLTISELSGEHSYFPELTLFSSSLFLSDTIFTVGTGENIYYNLNI